MEVHDPVGHAAATIARPKAAEHLGCFPSSVLEPTPVLRMFRGPLTCGLVAISMLCFTVADEAAGSVRLVRDADPGNVTFTRSHFWRVRGFDQGWAYQHAFGLDPADAAAHPEWVLHTSGGATVAIGTRVAADFGNASFRAWWIARAQAALASGNRGLWIDDVAMTRTVTAVDPRTGLNFTEANWQRNMADFMVAVRAALPSAEIVHDVLWYKGDTNADVLRELRAADYLSLDKGYNDPLISYGTGTYGFQTLSGWIDRAQARGTGVVLDSPAATPDARLYALATALLTDGGRVALADDPFTAPGTYWTGFDRDFGGALGGRYYTGDNVWRRDYEHAIVLVNEPLRPTRTVTVPAGYMDLDGVPRTSVTLAGGSGAVLVAAPVPAPTPTPTPVAPPVEPAQTATPTAPKVTTTRPSGSSTRARISTVSHTGRHTRAASDIDGGARCARPPLRHRQGRRRRQCPADGREAPRQRLGRRAQRLGDRPQARHVLRRHARAPGRHLPRPRLVPGHRHRAALAQRLSHLSRVLPR